MKINVLFSDSSFIPNVSIKSLILIIAKDARISVTTNMHMYVCTSANSWRRQMAFSKMLQVAFATTRSRLSGIGLVQHTSLLQGQASSRHSSNFARCIASWKFHKNLHEWDAPASTVHYLSLSSCSRTTSGIFACYTHEYIPLEDVSSSQWYLKHHRQYFSSPVDLCLYFHSCFLSKSILSIAK